MIYDELPSQVPEAVVKRNNDDISSRTSIEYYTVKILEGSEKFIKKSFPLFKMLRQGEGERREEEKEERRRRGENIYPLVLC